MTFIVHCIILKNYKPFVICQVIRGNITNTIMLREFHMRLKLNALFWTSIEILNRVYDEQWQGIIPYSYEQKWSLKCIKKFDEVF